MKNEDNKHLINNVKKRNIKLSKEWRKCTKSKLKSLNSKFLI